MATKGRQATAQTKSFWGVDLYGVQYGAARDALAWAEYDRGRREAAAEFLRTALRQGATAAVLSAHAALRNSKEAY